MKFERAVVGLLGIIAIAVCAIALKLWLFSPSTLGDWTAVREIKDDEARKEAYAKWMKNLPVVRVQGGQIDATISP